MKLLIISDAWHPQVNGVVRTYEYLSAELEAKGHTVKVIGPWDFKRSMAMPGYGEIRLVLFPYRALTKMIEAYAPDAIHLSTEGPLGHAGRRYCLRNAIPFTTSYHTHFPDYVAQRVSRFFPFLYSFTHTAAKAFIRHFHAPSGQMMVATQSLEDTLRAWGFKNPMQRVTRGVHMDHFYPGPNTEYPHLKQPIALYVGRVAIEKNIEAFLAMAWEGSKIVVGDGPMLGSLQRAYPDVTFAGAQFGEALGAHYRSADVFVFPSKTDTFGLVLIEALACGLPVAAYDVTGPKDIITDPSLGTLCPPAQTKEGDAKNLGDAAAQALNSPKSTQHRAAHVKGYYTWENAADQYYKGIQKALSQQG